MPLGGWTCKELAMVFDLAHASKATQAFDPAVTKVALAMLADPLKTMSAIHEAMELLTRDPERLGRHNDRFDARWGPGNRLPLAPERKEVARQER